MNKTSSFLKLFKNVSRSNTSSTIKPEGKKREKEKEVEKRPYHLGFIQALTDDSVCVVASYV